MATTYSTPGVYIQEISTLPPSVAPVSTAIPAFIGPTERSDSPKVPQRVETLREFEDRFGGPPDVVQRIQVAANGTLGVLLASDPPLLYHSLRLYFENGGGPCYIVSTGPHGEPVGLEPVQGALKALEAVDEVTLIVLPDAVRLGAGDHRNACQDALMHCGTLGDRFAILDVRQTDTGDAAQDFRNDIAAFRAISSDYLRYGAAYTPYLHTALPLGYAPDRVMVSGAWVRLGGLQVRRTDPRKPDGSPDLRIPKVAIAAAEADKVAFSVADGDTPQLTITVPKGSEVKAEDVLTAWTAWSRTQPAGGFELAAGPEVDAAVVQATAASPLTLPLESLRSTNTGLFNQIRIVLAGQRALLPPSGAVAGIYARVDRERGVWKAPANVAVGAVLDLDRIITDGLQEGLNVDPVGGRSINAIRTFTGRGTLVWGARTLAGNDNEWRYVSVRRLFLMIEESAQQSTAFAVFEPNDANTWLKVRAMIESFLYGLWEQGALAGTKPEEAYFVHVGLGSTMTETDILEGRMIVQIGVAAVRPAEFIILVFSHKLQQS